MKGFVWFNRFDKSTHYIVVNADGWNAGSPSESWRLWL